MIHKIKALHNEGAGLSIRSIARELGISRNTVRKYLRMDEAAIGEQQSHRTRHKQLDDYRDYIVTLLSQFPHLSAVKVLRKLQASLRSRERFWDIRVPKIDSIFDNSLVPRPSWSPGVPPQHRKLVAATHRSPI